MVSQKKVKKRALYYGCCKLIHCEKTNKYVGVCDYMILFSFVLFYFVSRFFFSCFCVSPLFLFFFSPSVSISSLLILLLVCSHFVSELDYLKVKKAFQEYSFGLPLALTYYLRLHLTLNPSWVLVLM